MKVLIAEDDPVSRHLLEATLHKLGFEVSSACDGVAALAMLQRGDAPSLVILDWMMPGLDGVEVCRRLRSRPPDKFSYIILLTVKADMDSIVAGLDSGADDYITKPFDARELRARLSAGRRIVQLEEALRLQATQDALTGAFNRKGIFEMLQRELARAERAGASIGVILADLDHFKRINDTFGHLVGDAVLKEAAQRMTALLRPADALGRYGGEEFLIVAPGCATPEVMKLAERLRHGIAAAPATTAQASIPFTISLGAVATGIVAPKDPASLLRLADEGLYQAKRDGRNRVGLIPG